MSVVEQPVDGGGGQGFGHDRAEPIWGAHMFVLTERRCQLVRSSTRSAFDNGRKAKSVLVRSVPS